MKKLIIENHLGAKELELEVFVEGQDFEYEFTNPTCFWLGKIMLLDLATIEKRKKERAEALVDHILGEVLPPVEVKPELEVKPEPEPEIEPKEEVKGEPETVGNTSGGDSGTRPPDEPESAERLPEKHRRGQARKRSK